MQVIMKSIMFVFTVAMALFLSGSILGCGEKPIKYPTIHEAAEKGDLADVKNHLRRGVAVNAIDRYGVPPLFYAVEGGHLKVANYLIRKGADVNIGVRGESPLRIAADEGHLDLVKLLIKRGADIEKYGSVAIREALDGDYIEIVKFLIKKGVIPSGASLLVAIEQGDLKVVMLFIAAGADVNRYARTRGPEDLRTPLYVAISGGNTDAVKILIEAGADVNMEGLERRDDLMPLHVALMREESINIDIINLLLSNGADPNAKSRDRGYTPLYRAIRASNIEAIHLLIEKGADVNLTGAYNRTLIDHARGNVEIVNLLRKHGAKE